MVHNWQRGEQSSWQEKENQHGNLGQERCNLGDWLGEFLWRRRKGGIEWAEGEGQKYGRSQASKRFGCWEVQTIFHCARGKVEGVFVLQIKDAALNRNTIASQKEGKLGYVGVEHKVFGLNWTPSPVSITFFIKSRKQSPGTQWPFLLLANKHH